MHPRTVATLEALRAARWFENVGKQDTKNAIVLSSWKLAIRHCSSVQWENLEIEAANQYRNRLEEKEPGCLGRWNDLVDEMKEVTEPFVHEKIDETVRQFNLGPKFEGVVKWDVLHLCMESEYADVFPPGFFASNAYWYMKGHFPCGWQGDFPNGMLIIY